MNTHRRQGDVLAIESENVTIDQLRKHGQLISKNECTLALGEATGHSHRVVSTPIDDQAIGLFTLNNRNYLYIPDVFGSVPVVHEEHNPMPLPPGIHEIRIQQEWVYGRAINVAD
jgi:hypothetical protein